MRMLKKNKYFIALIILIAAVVVFNVIWIVQDQSPPLWDIAAHSARSVDFARMIVDFDLRGILDYRSIYPPATYLLTGFLFLIFGFYEDIPQFALLIYVVVFLAGVYGIAFELFRKKDIALFPVFLVSVYPLLAHFTRIYDLDFPLVAMVTVSVYALLKTRNFSDLKWSILLGVFIAVGILTKWTFVIFFVGPFFVYALYFFKKIKKDGKILYEDRSRPVLTKKILKNFGICVLMFVILAMPWYLKNGRAVWQSSQMTRNNVFSVPYENLFSLGNISYYAERLMYGISWPLTSLFLIGLFFVFYKRKKENWILLSWIFVPYILMTFFLYSKESRYFLPAFPAVAIVSASLLFYFKKNWFKIFIIAFTVVFGIFFWVETSWGTRMLGAGINYERSGIGNHYGYYNLTTEDVWFGPTYPTARQANVREIPRAILEDKEERGTLKRKSKIAVVPNSIYLSAAPVQFYGNLIGLEADYSLSSRIRSGDFFELLPEADYIITKTGEQGPKVWRGQLDEIAIEEKNPSSEIFSQYELIGKWELSGIENKVREARLYRKK